MVIPPFPHHFTGFPGAGRFFNDVLSVVPVPLNKLKILGLGWTQTQGVPGFSSKSSPRSGSQSLGPRNPGMDLKSHPTIPGCSTPFPGHLQGQSSLSFPAAGEDVREKFQVRAKVKVLMLVGSLPTMGSFLLIIHHGINPINYPPWDPSH